MDKTKVIRLFNQRVSFTYIPKHIIIVLVVFLVSVFLFFIALSSGSTIVPLTEVFEELLNQGDGSYTFVIRVLRLPRMLLALLAGMGLGVAGLLLQSIVRNPLASPDVIGITGGAKVAAVITLMYVTKHRLIILPIAAVLGALFVTMLIYVLAWKGRVSPIRLVLVGIGIDAVMGAIVTLLIVISPVYSTSEAYIWITGSVYGSNWTHVQYLLPWIVFGIPLALFFTRQIGLQELGDDIATSGGLAIQKSRAGLILLCVCLAGPAIAFAGGIGFVGLIAPHIAKTLVSRSYNTLILLSALIGGMIIVIADMIARTLFLPLDLPAGVFVAGIGAPFFIYLLYKNRHL